MNRPHPDLALALLRVSLGVMYLAHSVLLKLFTYGLTGTAAFFQKVGLPGWLAFVTFAAEAVGGVLLVAGVQARWTAALLSPALLGAIVFVHGAGGWVFTAPGGGWEYPLFLLSASLAVIVGGPGSLKAGAMRPAPPVQGAV